MTQSPATTPAGHKHRTRFWAAVIALGCLVTLGVAPIPLVDSDAPLYGRIALNVLSSGDWLHFTYPDWYVDKPPVVFWFMAASFRLLGPSEASMRAWQLLLALALVALTYRLARQAGLGREEGALAAMVLVTSVQFFYHTTVPQQDIPLTLFLTLALSGILSYLHDGRARWVVLTAAAVALAALTKGIAGPGLAGIAGLAVLLVVRPPLPHPARGTLLHAALAAAVFAGLVLPWYVHGVLRDGQQFVTTFLTSGTMGLGRFVRPAISVPPPYWLSVFAYVPLLFLGMLPWSSIFFARLGEVGRLVRVGPVPLRIVAVWGLVLFATLSLSSGDKVFRYILPCYPSAAVLTGRAAAALLGDARRLRHAGWIALVPALGLIVGAFYMLWAQFPPARALWLPVLLPFALAMGGGIFAFGIAALRGRGRVALIAAAVGALAAYMAFEVRMMADAPRINPWPRLAASLAPYTAGSDRLVLLGRARDGYNFARFYLDEPVTGLDGGEALLALWPRERLLVVVPTEEVPRLAALLTPPPSVLVASPAGLAVLANWDVGSIRGTAP